MQTTSTHNIERLIDLHLQIIDELKAMRELPSVIVNPVSDFRVKLKGERRVECTWKAHVTGEMDIEYYRAGEKEWKHSVARYRQAIKIEDEQTRIGFNSNVGIAYFRVVVDGEVVATAQIASKLTHEGKEITHENKSIVI